MLQRSPWTHCTWCFCQSSSPVPGRWSLHHPSEPARPPTWMRTLGPRVRLAPSPMDLQLLPGKMGLWPLSQGEGPRLEGGWLELVRAPRDGGIVGLGSDRGPSRTFRRSAWILTGRGGAPPTCSCFLCWQCGEGWVPLLLASSARQNCSRKRSPGVRSPDSEKGHEVLWDQHGPGLLAGGPMRRQRPCVAEERAACHTLCPVSASTSISDFCSWPFSLG